jgi:hypothetical protein
MDLVPKVSQKLQEFILITKMFKIYYYFGMCASFNGELDDKIAKKSEHFCIVIHTMSCKACKYVIFV